jgi:hypothetical protein
MTDDQPTERLEQAPRCQAKHWPIDHGRPGTAATWALLKLIEDQDEELVDEVLTQLEDGRLDLAVCEDWDDGHVIITLATSRSSPSHAASSPARRRANPRRTFLFAENSLPRTPEAPRCTLAVCLAAGFPRGAAPIL